MLYDGKKPEDLSRDELEAAAVYCARMKHWAALVFEQNDAGLEELAQEYERRLGIKLEVTYSTYDHERPERLN
jgi:hypothetical protein